MPPTAACLNTNSTLQPLQQLSMQVTASFDMWGMVMDNISVGNNKHDNCNSKGSGGSASSMTGPALLSQWNGIHHTPKLLSTPPSTATTLLCIPVNPAGGYSCSHCH